MLMVSLAMLAYEVYDGIKRVNERRALSAAEFEIEYLEKELAVARRNQYDDGEKRRKFKR